MKQKNWKTKWKKERLMKTKEVNEEGEMNKDKRKR